MGEIMDKLPKDYLEGFNNGYEFSKVFPEVGQIILEQNKVSTEKSPVGGMLDGIKQGLNEDRELVNNRLSELNEIEKSKDNSRGHDIER